MFQPYIGMFVTNIFIDELAKQEDIACSTQYRYEVEELYGHHHLPG